MLTELVPSVLLVELNTQRAKKLDLHHHQYEYYKQKIVLENKKYNILGLRFWQTSSSQAENRSNCCEYKVPADYKIDKKKKNNTKTLTGKWKSREMRGPVSNIRVCQNYKLLRPTRIQKLELLRDSRQQQSNT